MTLIGVTVVILAIIFCFLAVVATSIKLAAISLLCAATFSAPSMIPNRRRGRRQADKRCEEESHDDDDMMMMMMMMNV